MLLLRGLRRGQEAVNAAATAAVLVVQQQKQPVLAQQQRLFSAAANPDEAEDLPAYDAAVEGRPVRVHQLIGDPRTGIADDTTQPLHGDLSVEWIWHQDVNSVDWYRYSLAGRDQLPNMHMDSRLSDHSKNLMYLLRCKDPARCVMRATAAAAALRRLPAAAALFACCLLRVWPPLNKESMHAINLSMQAILITTQNHPTNAKQRSWTIEALASKFRIRRQRALAILALKELEAQAVEEGRLMAGPLRAFAFNVDLDDVRLDGATGEPLDLGDIVHSTPAAARAAAAAAAEAAARRAQAGGGAGGDGGGQAAAAAAASAADSVIGSLADFLEGGGGGASTDGGPAAAAAADADGDSGDDALSLLQRAARGQRHDLAVVAPRLAATAQRAHLALLRRLARAGYDADELRAQLLATLGAAEAAWRAHVAGTPLEAKLIAAARELEAAAGSSGQQQAEQQQEGGSMAEAAADGEAEGAGSGEGGSAPQPLPRCLDFDWQRRQVEAAVAAAAPLIALAGDPAEREAARLALKLRRALAALEPQQQQQPEGGDQQQQQQQEQPAADAAAAELSALVEGAPPAALAAAFNALPLASRRRLLEAAPAARAALAVRGADLRAAVEGFSPARAALSAITGSSASAGNASGSGSGVGGAASFGRLEQLPAWPGETPVLVDAFEYREVPRAALDAAVDALRPLAAAERQLSALLAAAAGGGGDAAGVDAAGGLGGAGSAGVAEVDALREAAGVYSTLCWAYDRAIDEQAALLAETESGAPPPPPPNGQRRLMRVLRELDPNGARAFLQRLAAVMLCGGSNTHCIGSRTTYTHIHTSHTSHL